MQSDKLIDSCPVNCVTAKPKGIRRSRILLFISIYFLFKVSKSFTADNAVEEMHHIFFKQGHSRRSAIRKQIRIKQIENGGEVKASNYINIKIIPVQFFFPSPDDIICD